MGKSKQSSILTGAAFFLALPAFAAEAESSSHIDPVAAVVLSLAVILLGAKLGGHLATRMGQPSVLGELAMGVVLGNLSLFGFTALDYLKTDPSIDMLSKLGVILLLFMVGLESTVAQMLKVGWSSFLVAVLGVIGPFALGWGVGAWLLPEHSSYMHAFLGAALTATSVGITARVLKDLGRSQTTESRIILGAAVIDDVLGLIILAVVSGIISAANAGGEMSYIAVGMTLLKAVVFLVGALVIGGRIAPRLFGLASKFQASGVLLAFGLSFCFVLAYLANVIGLAPIVGAFAAGLILEDVHYRDFTDRGEHSLEHLVEPIASFLVPVFFMLMGMRTDLRSFGDMNVLGLAGALCIAAIIGKQLAMLGVLEKGLDRLSVGIGMIPRGEVGLIFANIGLTLVLGGERIVDQSTFSAVVVMVIVTTVVTPPLLKWSLNRRRLVNIASDGDGR
ncbi:MAG: cation:proton antiporter [Acidobacteria bacterium]|nr:cation:proton antiporter [Acidobacteriota bacterium]